MRPFVAEVSKEVKGLLTHVSTSPLKQRNDD